MNYQNYQNLMLLTSSDTKRTLMHLFLFTNSVQRELFQYVRRVYTTEINFYCITPLHLYLTNGLEKNVRGRVCKKYESKTASARKMRIYNTQYRALKTLFLN